MHPIEQAVREAATICPHPCKLTFDLLTLKVVFESGVTWGTSVPILVFLGLSVLDLGPMYATDTDVRRASLLNALYPRGGGIIIFYTQSDICLRDPYQISYESLSPMSFFQFKNSCHKFRLLYRQLSDDDADKQRKRCQKRRFEFLLRYSEAEALKG